MIGKVENKIIIQNIIASVFDKKGIVKLMKKLKENNSDLNIYSTGGTYDLLSKEMEVIEVSKYTGMKEMEGGLVKTLHPIIHAGILAERNNLEHEKYLNEIGAEYIDLVVSNLYPFNGGDIEIARGNIDIGGTTMIRAAAKNFLSCAVLVSPNQYDQFLNDVKDGFTTLEQRHKLARQCFNYTSQYEIRISSFFQRGGIDGKRYGC